MKRMFLILFSVWLFSWFIGCAEEKPQFEEAITPISLDRNYVKDEKGRYLHFRGTNVGGSTKVPYAIDYTSDVFTGGYEIPVFTYVGRPFLEADADKYFAQLKRFGFNVIRLLFMWEAVYPHKKGEPDTEFLDYYEMLIRKANEHGIYVLLNMHENMWSRHLYAMYNEDADGEKGELMNMLLSLFPPEPDQPLHPCSTEGKEAGLTCNPDLPTYNQFPFGYNDVVKGDGAPFWATRICLPEKDFDSPYWGIHPLLGGMMKDERGKNKSDPPDGKPDLLNFLENPIYKAYLENEMGLPVDDILEQLTPILPAESFDRTETTDFLPWTMWGANVVVSLDAERCYASFYAGDKVYPDLRVVTVTDNEGRTYDVTKHIDDLDDPDDGQNLKDYLQESYADVWGEMAKRASKYPNVIGYDIINEPFSVFLMLTAVAAYFETGLESALQGVLTTLLDMELPAGTTLPGVPEDDPNAENLGNNLFHLLKFLEMLPADKTDETKAKWGFKDADLLSIAMLNNDFDNTYLRALYERVGEAILAHDPDAILHLEPGFNVGSYLGGGSGLGGQWEQYMRLPQIDSQFIYSPHWYPDIYPMLGFNMPSREFGVEEYRYRDYTPHLKEKLEWAPYALENIPVIFGEFGTYWNFRYRGEDESLTNYEQSRKNDYRISAEIMDNYYEAFEALFLSNINWCYTTDNHPKYGDWWDHEDFSIIDENQQPRGGKAWIRPYPKALSGNPVSMHFYSPYHYFDPEKGKLNQEQEFELVFQSKETDAPTVVFVPKLQYPDGFYVWLSDGFAAWDDANQTLYFHPEEDDPDHEHTLTIRPPLKGQEIDGWDYFISATGDVVSAVK